MTYSASVRRWAVDSVTAQVNRLRTLVAELRKLSDLETRELEREPVDMAELLEEAFALACQSIQTNNPGDLRIVRIKNTLELETLWISENLRKELRS